MIFGFLGGLRGGGDGGGDDNTLTHMKATMGALTWLRRLRGLRANTHTRAQAGTLGLTLMFIHCHPPVRRCVCAGGGVRWWRFKVVAV